MKVTRHGVIDFKNEEEKSFYAIFIKQTLKKIFEVNVSELSTILTTLGIKLPAEVKEYCYYDTHDVEMKFETGETVIFHMGHMLSPYPYITCNGEEWILIAKDRKVAKLERFKMLI